MDTRKTDEAVLRELNMRSFKSEDEHSREMLGPILSDDFDIARAIWKIEDKQQMLDRIAADKSERLRSVDEANVKIYRDRAVVTSCVTLKEKGGDVVGRYWNTKVFALRELAVRCLASRDNRCKNLRFRSSRVPPWA